MRKDDLGLSQKLFGVDFIEFTSLAESSRFSDSKGEEIAEDQFLTEAAAPFIKLAENPNLLWESADYPASQQVAGVSQQAAFEEAAGRSIGNSVQVIEITSGSDFSKGDYGAGKDFYSAPRPFGDPMAAKPDGAGGGGGNGGGGNGGGGKGGDGDSDTTLLSSYVSGDDSIDDGNEFNVEIIFKNGDWTESLQQIFVDAADYLSSIITGDIADVFFRGNTIDDIRIDAKITSIDGEGGVLGQAGPTVYRTADYLPAMAVMEFDVADASYYEGLGLFDDIVVHEMLHSIGFGTMWDLMGLTSGSIADGTLEFIGSNAMEAYKTEFGGTGGIPIETDGGSGTAGGHWDDDLFQNELMTGYIGTPSDPYASNYISTMTIAALEDMGYETIWGAASYPDPINELLLV